MTLASRLCACATYEPFGENLLLVIVVEIAYVY